MEMEEAKELTYWKGRCKAVEHRMDQLEREIRRLKGCHPIRGIIRKMDPNIVSPPFGNDLYNDMPDVLIPFRDGTAG